MHASLHPTDAAGYPKPWIDALLGAHLAADGPTRVLGIAGVQGTGKSTLARDMVAAARARGVEAVAMSIDDVYLTRGQRTALAGAVHPLLATRGPPGTHDVALACQTLDALRQQRPGQTVELPGFDKIDDERLPRSCWRRQHEPARLIIFEGWFLKVPAQDDAALEQPINALEREHDPDGTWRRWCNAALPGYAPLWSRIDHLLVLQPPDFEVVRRWRWQQEQTLQSQSPGRRTMDHGQVMRFIAFFERVSRHALSVWPDLADTHVRIDAQRRLQPAPVAGSQAP